MVRSAGAVAASAVGATGVPSRSKAAIGRRSRTGVPFLVFALLAVAAPAARAGPRVTMELVTQPRFPAARSHAWYKAVAGHGIDALRIRAQRRGEVVTPSVATVGAGELRQIRVVGLLTTGGRLRLPGATFRIGEVTRLEQYVARLKAGKQQGKEQTDQRRFGLDADQLRQLVAALSVTLEPQLRGRPCRTIIAAAGEKLGRPLAFTPRAGQQFRGELPTTVPVDTLTLGTSLAAELGRQGLALRPHSRGNGTVALVVQVDDGQDEVWPVGWPLKQRSPPPIPALMQRSEYEIRGVSLARALDALAPRLGAPLLVDHRGLEQAGIDPAKVPVSFPQKKTYLKRVLDRILFEAQLKAHLRVDEAGHPFVWVAPLKR